MAVENFLWVMSPTRLPTLLESPLPHAGTSQPAKRQKRLRQKPSSAPGCLKCRMRKKKCDGRRPTCLGCERNVLLCNWPDEGESSSIVVIEHRRLSSSHLQHAQSSSTSCSSSRSSSTASAVTSRVSSIPSTEAHPAPSLLNTSWMKILDQPALCRRMLKDPNSSMLYEHWIRDTANALSALQGSRNAFVTELPKIALQYPDMVLQSLLALSGVHYCNRSKNNVIQQLTYTHLAQAIQAMKYGLTKLVSGEDNNALPLLVTTLIFCFIETVRGDDKGNLRYHLRAARPLLSKVLQSSELRLEESMLEFLKEYYAYIANITDLSIDKEATTPDLDALRAEPLTSDKTPGVLLGCAYRLFELIPEMSDLARQQERLNSTISTSQLEQQYVENETYAVVQKRQEMQSRIMSWEPPENCDPDFELCGRIYQQAFLIYNSTVSLHWRDISNPSQVAFVGQSIDNVLNLLSALPVRAPISATLVWPLAFLGTLSLEQHQREAIRNRLQDIWNLWGLGNVKATIDFLTRYWADNDLDQGWTQPAYHGHLAGLMERYGLNISFV